MFLNCFWPIGKIFLFHTSKNSSFISWPLFVLIYLWLQYSRPLGRKQWLLTSPFSWTFFSTVFILVFSSTAFVFHCNNKRSVAFYIFLLLLLSWKLEHNHYTIVSCACFSIFYKSCKLVILFVFWHTWSNRDLIKQ